MNRALLFKHFSLLHKFSALMQMVKTVLVLGTVIWLELDAHDFLVEF